MKIKRYISVLLFLAILCGLVVALVSCSSNKSPKDYDAKIVVAIKGLDVTKSVKLKLTNIDTHEQYQVKCKSISLWKSEVELDYGTYQIEDVTIKGIDSDVTFDNQSFVVSEDTSKIEIDAHEVDHTGTNALTLLGMVGCFVGLIVVKSKRNRSTTSLGGMA